MTLFLVSSFMVLNLAFAVNLLVNSAFVYHSLTLMTVGQAQGIPATSFGIENKRGDVGIKNSQVCSGCAFHRTLLSFF